MPVPQNTAKGGVLPRRKPNKHRESPRYGVPPLKYPPDVHDEAVPREAREELKARIRAAHRDVAFSAMELYLEQERAALEEVLNDGVDDPTVPVDSGPA